MIGCVGMKGSDGRIVDNKPYLSSFLPRNVRHTIILISERFKERKTNRAVISRGTGAAQIQSRRGAMEATPLNVG